jgi:hypothetical protein
MQADKDPFRMDKTAFSVVSRNEDPEDVEYWHSKTPSERLEAMELMRQVLYGYDPASERLQRFLEIAEFKIR